MDILYLHGKFVIYLASEKITQLSQLTQRVSYDYFTRWKNNAWAVWGPL